MNDGDFQKELAARDELIKLLLDQVNTLSKYLRVYFYRDPMGNLALKALGETQDRPEICHCGMFLHPGQPCYQFVPSGYTKEAKADQ